MKRNILFIIGLFAAAFVSLMLSFPLAMNECQLNETQAEIQACFENAQRGSRIHNWVALAFVALTVSLHAWRSRWVALGLIGLAIGPFIAWAFIF